MKGLKTLAVIVAAALAVTSCDNTELQEKVDDLESRVSKLEQDVESMQSSLNTLKTLVDKLSGGYLVSAVNKTSDGYTIIFTDGSSIDLYNGKDGRVPSISVKQDTDGNWYWTLDGEWLRDASNNRIKANGDDALAPQVKVEDGYWKLSTDGGKTWTVLAPYHDAEAVLIKNIDTESDPEGIVITLSDNTVITLPRKKTLELHLEAEELVFLGPGETKTMGFTLTGGTKNNTVKALGQGGWIATVEMDGSQGGIISVVAPNPFAESELVIIVSDGDGFTLVGSLKLLQSSNPLGISSPEGVLYSYDKVSHQIGIYSAEGCSWFRYLIPQTLSGYEIGPIPDDIDVSYTFQGKFTAISGGLASSSRECHFAVTGKSAGILYLKDDEGYYYVIRAI